MFNTRDPFGPNDIICLTIKQKHLLQPDLQLIISKTLDENSVEKELTVDEKREEIIRLFGSQNSLQLAHYNSCLAFTSFFDGTGTEESILHQVDSALAVFADEYGPLAFFFLSLSQMEQHW